MFILSIEILIRFQHIENIFYIFRQIQLQKFSSLSLLNLVNLNNILVNNNLSPLQRKIYNSILQMAFIKYNSKSYLSQYLSLAINQNLFVVHFISS